MRAIRVFLDSEDTDHIGGVVEQINCYPPAAALMCSHNEIFVAAKGKSALKYVQKIIDAEFKEAYSIEYVK